MIRVGRHEVDARPVGAVARTLRAAAFASSTACSFAALGVLAQAPGAVASPREAALTARIARDPGDTGALCELGYVLVRSSRPTAAIPLLDRAVTLLGDPSEVPLRRRLAACPYNRGLAEADTGDVANARVDFRRSIALRPNAAVQSALLRLPEAADTLAIHEPSRSVLDAAIRACERAFEGTRCTPHERDPVRQPSSGECDDGTRWFLVELATTRGPNPGRATAVVADRGGTLRTDFVDHREDGASLPVFDVDAELRMLAPDRCGLAVETRFRWVVASQEGAYDCSEDALSVLYFAGDALRTVAFTTSRYDDRDQFDLDVDLDGHGNLVVRAYAGDVPGELRPWVGTHALDAMARDPAPAP